MNTTNKTDEKLELAVDRYIDALDVSDLIQIVADNLWDHYKRSASDEEIHDFIDAMQITDDDIEPAVD